MTDKQREALVVQAVADDVRERIGRDKERDAVVAWLRAKRNLMGDMPNKACRWADSIERGEHRHQEER